MSYDEEREALYEMQNGIGVAVPFTRCARNMPLKTNTIGTDKVIDYAENAPAPAHWKVFKVFKVENCTTPNGPTIGIDMNKYQRKLTNPTYVQRESQCDPSDLASIDEDVIIDVYDVLDAFDVSNPATAHAIKKLLCTGSRGAKDWETDLQEAIDSLERAKSFPPMPF